MSDKIKNRDTVISRQRISFERLNSYFIIAENLPNVNKRRDGKMKYSQIKAQGMNCFEYLQSLINQGYRTAKEVMEVLG